MKLLKKQKGSAILITFLVLGVLLIAALSVTFVTIQEFKASQSASKTTATYQVADEGIEAVMYEIIQAGYSQIDELHYCQTNGKIGREDFGYEVTLLDENENMISCRDDGNSPISDIKKIKSVGTLIGQNQRSVVAFVPIACNGENDDEYNQLLLHFDGGDTGDDFVDATDNHSVNVKGDTEISKEEKVFCKSAHFDGSGDYLEISDSSDWDFGADDFTIDFWVRFDTMPSGTAYSVFEQFQDTNNFIRLNFWESGSKYGFQFQEYLNGGATNFAVGPNYSTDWSADTWYHIALVRSGDDWSIYKNGILDSSTTDNQSISNLAGDLNIGYDNGYYMKGYIDELRVSKGVARWTDDFDPPVYPY